MANSDLRREIARVLNGYSAENGSNTPDHILAEYMLDCLEAFDKALRLRAAWYVRMDVPGQGSQPYKLVDERSHSRACGIWNHPHGSLCAKDCPTCNSWIYRR